MNNGSTETVARPGPDPRSSSKESARLLGLSTEILSQICEKLSRRSLAEFRLVCKDLKTIPERHLFHTIIIESQLRSVERLGYLSQHEHLASFVQCIKFDTSQYPHLGRHDWEDQIGLYQPFLSKEDTQFHPGHTYKALAIHYKALDPQSDSLNYCFDDYLHTVRQQDFLVYDMASTSVYCFFRSFFSGFPNLMTIKCTGGWASKYGVQGHKPDEIAALRDSQLETLIVPSTDVSHEDGVPELVATFVLAALSSANKLSTVALCGISANVMKYLGEPPMTDMPSVRAPGSSLKTLRLFLDSVPEEWQDEDVDILDATHKFLNANSELQEFVHWGDLESCSKGRFPPFNERALRHCNLKRLELRRCQIDSLGFREVIFALRRTLENLVLSDIYLRSGNWPDTFSSLRSLTKLLLVELSGSFYSDDGILEVGLDDFVTFTRLLESEWGPSILRNRVLAHILGDPISPFLPSDCNHAQRQWECASDWSMSYTSWPTWIDLPTRKPLTQIGDPRYGVDFANDSPASPAYWLDLEIRGKSEPGGEFPLQDPRVDQESIEYFIIEHASPNWEGLVDVEFEEEAPEEEAAEEEASAEEHEPTTSGGVPWYVIPEDWSAPQ